MMPVAAGVAIGAGRYAGEAAMLNAFFGDRLYTPRLYMRRMLAVDLPLICRWSHDVEACGSYLTPEGYCPDQLLEQLHSGALWRTRERFFCIETRADNQPLGTIHYWMRQDRGDIAVVAIKIAVTDLRGKGYGTEAQKYLMIHLFKQVGVRSVDMYTDVDNCPQQRCLQKLGFQLERSLTYGDRSVERNGLLYRLTTAAFAKHPVYQYHYD
ncbi:MAG: GNAT family protein [Desulfosarcinaceae bacterium]|jgi:RimJ/RimL family protein N-acetyltransferase